MIKKLVDEHSDSPLIIQVKDAVLTEILTGAIEENGKLLPRRQLAQRYSVSLMTVSRAIAQLVTEGMLFSRRGRRIYVSP